ncbi:hypothetical protein BRC82_03360 [Halobacteriales archaeon QS_1_67_19]|nr:MAG: hypothetical protein BRC82_03360 [Halobacteriales archaeon QS_1_67_19]
MAGAAAATVAAAGASGSAKAASYDTITVPAGSTKVIRVGSGETFENKLIDITASGAHIKVLTEGTGWTIRNIGVKGANDDTSDTYGCFYLRAEEGGEGLFENVYLGDGGGARTYHAAVSGYGNAGHVTVRNVNVQKWGADGMYLSQPGVDANLPEQGGTFTVENCFAKNNNIENIRIGTPGSVIRNCTVHVEGRHAVNANESGQKNPRGIWLKEQPGLTVEDCDVKINGADAIFASAGGEGVVKNSRIDGSIGGPVETQNVSGDPDLTPPEGVPMTAEAAAKGEIGSTDSDSSTTTEEETDDQQGSLFELVSGADTSQVKYEFTVEGSVSKRTAASGDAPVSETSDSVTDNDDGTVTVTGVAGNGYGDAYYVEGSITSMDVDESKWTLRLDGEEVTVADLTGTESDDGTDEQLPNMLVIDGNDSPNAVSTYTFTVSGSAEKTAEAGSTNSYDTVADGEIAGRVIGGTDAYRFSGDITGFSLDGPASVRVEET